MSEPAEAEVVTRMDQVTPAWLTEVLRRAGALGEARVARVEHECAETTFGTVARLRLRYTAAAAGPRRLFLKLTRPSLPAFVPEGDREARFYRHLASRTPASVARCYDAAFSSRTGELHLLLEDLSGTHRSEPPSTPPGGSSRRGR